MYPRGPRKIRLAFNSACEFFFVLISRDAMLLGINYTSLAGVTLVGLGYASRAALCFSGGAALLG